MLYIYMYIYVYIYMYIYKGEILKNHFHELLHIPGHSGDSLCQEDMYFVMLRHGISG